MWEIWRTKQEDPLLLLFSVKIRGGRKGEMESRHRFDPSVWYTSQWGPSTEALLGKGGICGQVANQTVRKIKKSVQQWLHFEVTSWLLSLKNMAVWLLYSIQEWIWNSFPQAFFPPEKLNSCLGVLPLNYPVQYNFCSWVTVIVSSLCIFHSLSLLHFLAILENVWLHRVKAA